jgi:hypothetical protein
VGELGSEYEQSWCGRQRGERKGNGVGSRRSGDSFSVSTVLEVDRSFPRLFADPSLLVMQETSDDAPLQTHPRSPSSALDRSRLNDRRVPRARRAGGHRNAVGKDSQTQRRWQGRSRRYSFARDGPSRAGDLKYGGEQTTCSTGRTFDCRS